ncbi:hypothetical protein GCM10009665_38350 [Kitasatospora nipponensis]|uniref:YCII-related domain-containing protein n=1 Tax=Kitasatospora nipponensis TaxID=258049 RepID=A0ABN1WB83_9ACTN
MGYLLLFVEPRGLRASRTPAESRAANDGMRDFAEGLVARGILVTAQMLSSDSRATRVQVRDGEVVHAAGPFPDSQQEMIGALMHIDVATESEALAIAEQCPAARWATVEVRPIGALDS